MSATLFFGDGERDRGWESADAAVAAAAASAGASASGVWRPLMDPSPMSLSKKLRLVTAAVRKPNSVSFLASRSSALVGPGGEMTFTCAAARMLLLLLPVPAVECCRMVAPPSDATVEEELAVTRVCTRTVVTAAAGGAAVAAAAAPAVAPLLDMVTRQRS